MHDACTSTGQNDLCCSVRLMTIIAHCPNNSKLPSLLQLLFFNRSLYVEEQLGSKYVEKRTIPFEVSYEETGPATPVFFVLSPGVDPLKDVEAVGKKLGFTLDDGNLHNVSLGQV